MCWYVVYLTSDYTVYLNKIIITKNKTFKIDTYLQQQLYIQF